MNNLRKLIREVLEQSNIFDIISADESLKKSSYYFNVDDYNYQVNFIKFQKDDRFYSLGFKAKKESSDYFDFDILTNKNPFKVMQTIAYITEKFYNKRKTELINDLKPYNAEDKWNLLFKGFIFSLHSKDPKKNRQRFLLYKRYLGRYDFEIKEENGIYYITK